jgi:hypothetical protein
VDEFANDRAIRLRAAKPSCTKIMGFIRYRARAAGRARPPKAGRCTQRGALCRYDSTLIEVHSGIGHRGHSFHPREVEQRDRTQHPA